MLRCWPAPPTSCQRPLPRAATTLASPRTGQTCPSSARIRPRTSLSAIGQFSRLVSPLLTGSSGRVVVVVVGRLLLPRYNLAYIAFFVQGLGGLLPWNAFITATGGRVLCAALWPCLEYPPLTTAPILLPAAYLASRLDGSSFASNFENYFSFSFQVTNLSFLFLASRFQQRLDTARLALRRLRLISPPLFPSKASRSNHALWCR